jgi:isopenicillin N synthase-like dioxygenase
VEEAFGIPVGTFDNFFKGPTSDSETSPSDGFLCAQHRMKLVKYPVAEKGTEGQGVGPHKDSSGWLTFLYQVGNERGLEVLGRDDNWLPANPISNSFVVNFGNAFEAATEGTVRATIHRVRAPTENVRYSIPFFMGLPLDLTVSKMRSLIPQEVRSMRWKEDGKSAVEESVSPFLDPRWDILGESQLRKWIRSHKDVGLKWYGSEIVEYYTQ